jgi:hypothetical protein
LIQKQEKDMSALKKKADATISAKQKEREDEEERIVRRQENFRKELDTKQNLQRIKIEVHLENQSKGKSTKGQNNAAQASTMYSSRGFSSSSPARKTGTK